MDKERTEQEFMSIIAYLYYYADMNQSEIAERLFLSRSTVSRLIKKARQSGVVELKINEPWQRDLPMEDKLKTFFGIDRVRVLSTNPEMSPDEVLNILGKMVTYYISCSVQDRSILGMSWGKTVAHVNNSITTNQNIPLTVVPIMGSLTYPDSNPESLKLSQRFAKVYGGRYFPLDAPLYAQSKDHLRNLLMDQSIAEAIDTARKADIIITSVGSIEGRSWDRLIGMDKLSKLRELGCVGHIGGHFFDINGHEINGSYKELHIGLSMDEIVKNGNVICIAASEKKAEAVYGALQGRLINSLMITYPLAVQLLEIIERRSL